MWRMWMRKLTPRGPGMNQSSGRRGRTAERTSAAGIEGEATMLLDATPGVVAEPVDYYTRRELQPLKGTLELYLSALKQIAAEWGQTDLATLQGAAQDIVPEAALFTVWQRLRSANGAGPPDSNGVREYLTSVQRSIANLLQEKYEEDDVRAVSELGTVPSRVADRYDELLNLQRSA
jgi:hypothetical protein